MQSSQSVNPAVIFIGANALALIVVGLYYGLGPGSTGEPKPMTFWRTVWAGVMALWIFSIFAEILYGLASSLI
jgi:hypothetical protein